MSDEQKQNRARRALGRVWAIADRYLWGTSAGKVVCGAVLALALSPVLPAATIALLAEPLNQVLDAVSEDPQ